MSVPGSLRDLRSGVVPFWYLQQLSENLHSSVVIPSTFLSALAGAPNGLHLSGAPKSHVYIMAVDHQNLPSTLSNPSFHPATDIPPRTSSSHGVTGSSPTIPRRKSSKRPMSQSSGDWFSGKKPAVTSSITAANTSAGPSHPTSNDKSLFPHVSANKKNAYLATASQSSPPPPDPLKEIGHDLIYQQHGTWSPEKEKILLGPFDYMFSQPGKDIRAQLIAAFNAWLKVPERSLSVITKVVGMLHTASLL